MSRVVLDTSVVVAAFRSRRGGSFAVLLDIANRRHTLVATTALFLEYEDVLKRPEQRGAHGRTAAELDRALVDLASLCDPVQVHFRWRPQTVDPGDDLVIEAAVNGRADLIVTFNVRHLAAPSARFGIRTTTPGAWLKEQGP